MSHPCFEFFLLLHKTDCTQYSPEDVKATQRSVIAHSWRGIEEVCKWIQEDSLRFLDFWDNLSDAMQIVCFMHGPSLKSKTKLERISISCTRIQGTSL